MVVLIDAVGVSGSGKTKTLEYLIRVSAAKATTSALIPLFYIEK